ncbi:MAG TPA: ADP-forming succinate--CoA ligase subunit beta [Acidobacteriota bacterium]|nr:ADP-forming succinate--CoA ligase subunit beta [Acidobacteriota bacterium]HNT17293.1 ADP-forming succinate--CoA ligase subunit beta [Acidobacteriota bacterium]HPA26356.1 ADP-forming succinate--CoA ligase subunit beta [Acidobacteriota bacterium]HQO19748.1 ADP-forming succinate--CoA ligase subunit beta [Acidobacteriota bacterium]HQQ46338.1 ADP-forming succinate--CoA ligase subunit beta [Acidobacteriota bacterium]
MKVHEYQAKEVLSKFGVPVPKGRVAFSADEAFSIAKEIGGTVVVKSQIHAGGRGKGKFTSGFQGGVKLAKTPEEAKELASKMVGNILVTHQTGPEGKKVEKLYITEASDIKKEYYLGIVLDRARECNVIMASTEGGVEIEKVAAETPEKIVKVWVDPMLGLQKFQVRELGFALGFEGDTMKSFGGLIEKLYAAHEASDSTLTEINPLITTPDGKVIALDAKMNFDDNALFRHPDIAALRDITEEDPLEVEASKFDLNYIKLDGTIGCMVNGAGLAMATMDVITLEGGVPANFLDVGGGATTERVKNAFRILLSDKNVKAVMINIFGGIVRCDIIAEGVIAAAKEIGIRLPVVVRLQGTNAEKGMEMLKSSGQNLLTASSLQEAAALAVKASKGE